MKFLSILIALAITVSVSGPALASGESESKKSDSIFIGSFGQLHSWRAVSRDEIIVWASPSRPYLIKTWRPTSSLRFANAIGVTSTVGRVTTFDKIIVDGQRLPIKSITAIDREAAKSMRWTKKQST